MEVESVNYTICALHAHPFNIESISQEGFFQTVLENLQYFKSVILSPEGQQTLEIARKRHDNFNYGTQQSQL